MSIGKSVKYFFKRLFSFWKVRIKSGPLQGYKFIVTTGSGFVRGDYEQEKTNIITGNTSEGDVVYDVGAHVGYYSMMMAKYAGPKGRVYSFEPRPLNNGFLRKHIAANHLENINVMDKAVSDVVGELRFNANTGTGTGHLSDTGNIVVNSTTIDTLVGEGMPVPNLIKIDVEGGEIGVLKGAVNTIEKNKPKIIFATHGDELHKFCVGFLEDRGYEINTFDQEHGDVESIAIYKG